jgi:hypothetical protein
MNIFLGLAKIQSCHELVRRVDHLEISKSSVSFSFLRGSTSRWWLDHLPSKLSNRIHDLSTGIFSQSISSMCCQSLGICGYVQEHEGTFPLGLFDTGVNAIFKQPLTLHVFIRWLKGPRFIVSMLVDSIHCCCRCNSDLSSSLRRIQHGSICGGGLIISTNRSLVDQKHLGPNHSCEGMCLNEKLHMFVLIKLMFHK